MSRGNSDFGNISASFAANQIDTGEIAHILSGFSLLDGLGRTVIIDNFKYGLGAWRKLAGAGAAIPIEIDKNYNTNGIIFSPPYSIYCYAGVTADTASAIAQGIYEGVQSRFGIETGFYINNATADIFMYMAYKTLLGVGDTAYIRISPKDGIIYCYTGTAWVNVGTFDKPTNPVFVRMQAKLVVDFELRKYVRLLVSDIPYDLRQYNLEPSALALAGVITYQLGAWSRGAGNEFSYIGFIRCSKDEP